MPYLPDRNRLRHVQLTNLAGIMSRASCISIGFRFRECSISITVNAVPEYGHHVLDGLVHHETVLRRDHLLVEKIVVMEVMTAIRACCPLPPSNSARSTSTCLVHVGRRPVFSSRKLNFLRSGRSVPAVIWQHSSIH
uniref:(northern house mosquito) hypothetical protein n=1 Tax=Culex pipiens TaxID=7175 RepID=A0A8D8IIX5_CULPI